LKQSTINEKTNWIAKYNNFIKNLREFPANSKIIMVLRHSHREKTNDWSKFADIKLTELGHETAINFGKQLPNDRPIRIYHSFIERCKETAEDILKGFKSISGNGELIGPLNELFDIGVKSKAFLKEFVKYQNEKFIFRWAAGLFSPKLIAPLQEYSQKAANVIWKGLELAPNRCIDIHVTHDLMLLSLRFGWFGLPPTEEWVDFLSGFAFTIRGSKIRLLDIENFKIIETPYWWKSQ